MSAFYAVVAADYAGLGTDSRSAVLDVPSDATDVIYAIAAAHVAVPQLSSRWVSMGPSLGGNVAIGVAEIEGADRDSNYLGSIAISGMADLRDASERWVTEKRRGMLEFVAYTVKTLYPDFAVRDMLTEKALSEYHHVNVNCGSLDTNPGLSASQMLKEGWQKNKLVVKLFARNVLGQKPAYGSLLLISGDADPEGLPAMTEQTFGRLCKQGDRVQIAKFSEPQSGMVMGDSVRDQMAWIEARFAGRSAVSNCP